MLMDRYIVSCLCLLLTALAPGCARVPPASIPVNTLLYAKKDTHHRSLVVLLPGITDKLVAYEKRGFIDALRSRGLGIDLIAVDAHFGYYKDRSVVERLKIDVIIPAKAHGYDEIWLVGVSLGGLGSLLYSLHYPGDVKGMLILAPFLGEPQLINEISEGGGPANWQPGALSEEIGMRELWAWLKGYYNNNNNDLPLLYLGYGRSDKFEVANSLLASLLPSDQVCVTSGGHNWRTWRSLWDKALDGGILTYMASPARAPPSSNGKAWLQCANRE